MVRKPALLLFAFLLCAGVVLGIGEQENSSQDWEQGPQHGLMEFIKEISNELLEQQQQQQQEQQQRQQRLIPLPLRSSTGPLRAHRHLLWDATQQQVSSEYCTQSMTRPAFLPT